MDFRWGKQTNIKRFDHPFVNRLLFSPFEAGGFLMVKNTSASNRQVMKYPGCAPAEYQNTKSPFSGLSLTHELFFFLRSSRIWTGRRKEVFYIECFDFGQTVFKC